MNGSDLDAFARFLAAGGRTRRTLLAGLFLAGTAGQVAPTVVAKHGKKPKKITICSNGQTLKVRKKGWQGHYPGATIGACSEPTEPTGVCAGCPDTCFASLVVPDQDPNSIEYACCPAASVCVSQTPPYPDQCCYEGDACDPTLPIRDNTADMICCRPAGGCGPSKICCKSSEECVNGVCELANTARLPRTRRPA